MKFWSGMKVFWQWGVGSVLLLLSCQTQVAIEDISVPPAVVTEDAAYANVFQMLDGDWQGNFHIYEDTCKIRQRAAQPENLHENLFSTLPLKLIQTIEVTQSYTSETPYFQRVKIIDTYQKPNGEKQQVVSAGVNKIQNGKLWCVVVKPDETVIHQGILVDETTIIWARSKKTPLKIERFRETVQADVYTIYGWGYYGDDDPNMPPRMWFRGVYHRVKKEK